MKPVIIVGNKCDVIPQPPYTASDAQIAAQIKATQEYVSSWAKSLGYAVLECSAKDNTGVEAAMMAMVGSTVVHIRQTGAGVGQADTVASSKDSRNENRGKESGNGKGRQTVRSSTTIDELFASKPVEQSCCK